MISLNFDANVLFAQRNVNISSNYVNQALERLTTGFRINSPADDPAGYYLATTLNSELRALAVVQQNITDGINFMTTAQDSLGHMYDILNRVKNLALQGANDNLDTSGRNAIQMEADALLEELFRLENSAKFNEINVFGASNSEKTATAKDLTSTPPPESVQTLSGSASPSDSGSAVSEIEITVMQGANSGLTDDILVLSGSIKVGSGSQISTKGKTLEQIANAITAQGYVTASIQDGKFTIKSEDGEVNITAAGDFARITGIGSYTVQSAVTTNTSAENVYLSQGAATGLTGDEVILNGTIQVGGGAKIDAAGKTLNQIINEINSQGLVTASITGGKFTIESETPGGSITADGDFGRVTGLANYSVSGGSTTNIAGQSTTIVQGDAFNLSGTERAIGGTIRVGGGAEIDATGKTLNQIISEINAQGNVTASIRDGKFTISCTDGQINVQTTGDLSRITGLEDYVVSGCSQSSTPAENSVVCQGSATGLTGDVLIVSGTIRVGLGTEIDTKGKTLNQIISEINAQGNAVASIKDGRFTLVFEDATADTAIINVSGDMQRVIGFSDYRVSAGTTTDVIEEKTVLTGTVDVRNLPEFNCQTSGDISFVFQYVDGLPGKFLLSITQRYNTLESFLDRINNMGFSAEINADGKIQITVIGATDLRLESDSTGFGDYYGLTSATTENIAVNESTLTGSIDTGGYSGDAFYGQSTGQLTFSNGTTVSINANDNLDTVIQKINNAGLSASILSDGRIKITALERGSLLVSSDTTGFADFYGLSPTTKIYYGSYSRDEISNPATSTVTGSVDTSDLADMAFAGQTTGQISFSNGINVSISASDSRSDVINKINDAGLTASIGADGKIQISAENITGLTVTSDSSGFSEFYGLTPAGITYNGDRHETVEFSPGSSTLTGSVNTNSFADTAFFGQTNGQLSFSNGVDISISASDSRSDVINKINDAGLSAVIGSDGKIQITAQGVADLTVTSDTSGFADFYGLSSGKNYTGSVSTGSSVSKPATSTITGSVNTNNFADNYFYGQTNGQLSFSNGVNVSISASDSRSDVIDKINAAGLSAAVNSNGKIQITAENTVNLTVTSDTSGFANFYGLDNTEDIHNGNVSTSTEFIPNPNPPEHPQFDIDGLITKGISNIRLQVGINSSESSALYCDTTFVFDEFSLDLSSAKKCENVLDDIDAFMDAVKAKQADIGIYRSRLETIYDANLMRQQNKYAAYSTTMDADIAVETQKYVEYQILQQTSMSLLAQSQAARSQVIMTLLSSVIG